MNNSLSRMSVSTSGPGSYYYGNNQQIPQINQSNIVSLGSYYQNPINAMPASSYNNLNDVNLSDLDNMRYLYVFFFF